ncbi:putrescine hydroxycinnamoyltransferase 1-like [Asparagus officinalis]|uniref:putrescine hydroxycinnamoyltransferase 1-like n=1 Tax=Asparagus officinalis TaxID=4686 RepID=UPI00098E6A73|nr:putrescine hydroxycinnamoyltransferase 1-like [Asparagus officinalis]
MEVVESGIVAPSDETPKRRMWLSNFDLAFGVREHLPSIYHYRPNGNPNFFKVETLKASLSKALVHFYPLAGRLEVGPDGRIEINCTGEGVLFTVARCRYDVDAFGVFAPSEEMRQELVPTVESSQPPCMLFMVQVTFFKGGDVTLGLLSHHTAADGRSYFHFIKTWTDIARGITNISLLPFFDRSLLRARSPPSVTVDLIEYKKPPHSDFNTFRSPPPFNTAILTLSKNQVTALKKSTNKDKPSSTFKAVIAHVWRSSCIAPRLYPPLPTGYFGNAILRTSEGAKVRDIVSNSLELAGEKIQQAVAKADDEFARSLIDYLEMGNDEREWFLTKGDLLVISWLGMPIYEVDFGWGKPEFMRRANMFCGGVGYIMDGPGGSGDVSVVMAMETENMEGFKKAFYQGFDLCSGFQA